MNMYSIYHYVELLCHMYFEWNFYMEIVFIESFRALESFPYYRTYIYMNE